MSKVKSLGSWFAEWYRDIVQTCASDHREWRTQRAANQANIARGNYIDGTPMTKDDLKLYGLLDHAVIGGLTLLASLVVLLVVLGVTGS